MYSNILHIERYMRLNLLVLFVFFARLLVCLLSKALAKKSAHTQSMFQIFCFVLFCYFQVNLCVYMCDAK